MPNGGQQQPPPRGGQQQPPPRPRPKGPHSYSAEDLSAYLLWQVWSVTGAPVFGWAGGKISDSLADDGRNCDPKLDRMHNQNNWQGKLACREQGMIWVGTNLEKCIHHCVYPPGQGPPRPTDGSQCTPSLVSKRNAQRICSQKGLEYYGHDPANCTVECGPPGMTTTEEPRRAVLDGSQCDTPLTQAVAKRMCKEEGMIYRGWNPATCEIFCDYPATTTTIDKIGVIDGTQCNPPITRESAKKACEDQGLIYVGFDGENCQIFCKKRSTEMKIEDPEVQACIPPTDAQANAYCQDFEGKILDSIDRETCEVTCKDDTFMAEQVKEWRDSGFDPGGYYAGGRGAMELTGLDRTDSILQQARAKQTQQRVNTATQSLSQSLARRGGALPLSRGTFRTVLGNAQVLGHR